MHKNRYCINMFKKVALAFSWMFALQLQQGSLETSSTRTGSSSSSSFCRAVSRHDAPCKPISFASAFSTKYTVLQSSWKSNLMQPTFLASHQSPYRPRRRGSRHNMRGLAASRTSGDKDDGDDEEDDEDDDDFDEFNAELEARLLSNSGRSKRDALNYVMFMMEKNNMTSEMYSELVDRRQERQAQWTLPIQVDLPYIIFRYDGLLPLYRFREPQNEILAESGSANINSGLLNAILADSESLQSAITDTTMSEAFLRTLTCHAGHDDAMGQRPAAVLSDLITWVARTANQKQIALSDDRLVGKLHLWHNVYPAIPLLFQLFASCCGRNLVHVTDKVVDCVYLVQKGPLSTDLEATTTLRSSIRLDCAIIVPRVNLTLALLQLQPNQSSDNNPESESLQLLECQCAAVATMTLSAMKQAGCLKGNASIAVPFVIGVHNKVSLYVVRFQESAHKKRDSIGTPAAHPVVVDRMFDQVPLHDATPEATRTKHLFLKTLAVLLSKITRFVADNGTRLARPELGLPEMDGLTNIFSKESLFKIGMGVPKTTGRDRGPADNEDTAMKVAGLGGRIQQINSQKIGTLSFDGEITARDQEFMMYQQESPYFFSGAYFDLRTNGPVSVLCKVWREGDGHTNREDIALEIDLSLRAFYGGVPTPRVFTDLTRMDVEHVELGVVPDQYHILVMERYRDDYVAVQDILEYARATVLAVSKLHSTGILLGQVTLDNVKWDAREKVVRLLGFGKAQYFANGPPSGTTMAKRRRRTRDAYSVASDTHDVGFTLQIAIDEAGRNYIKYGASTSEGRRMGHVDSVAKMLMESSEPNRISLQEAAALLKSFTDAGAVPPSLSPLPPPPTLLQ